MKQYEEKQKKLRKKMEKDDKSDTENDKNDTEDDKNDTEDDSLSEDDKIANHQDATASKVNLKTEDNKSVKYEKPREDENEPPLYLVPFDSSMNIIEGDGIREVFLSIQGFLNQNEKNYKVYKI